MKRIPPPSSGRPWRGAAVLLLTGAVALVPTASTAAAGSDATRGPSARQTLRGVHEVVQAERLPAAALDLPDGVLAATPGTAHHPAALPTRHYLREADGDRVLLTGDLGALDDVAPGQPVTVTGRPSTTTAPEADAVLAVASATATAPAPEEDTEGVREVAVVLLRRGPAGVEPFTVDQARRSVFTADNSVAQFVEQSSFGALRLRGHERADGDVFGYLEIPESVACFTEGEAGAAAAAAAGIDLTPYDNVMYVLAYGSDGCGYGGWAFIGGSLSVTLANDESTARSVLHHELGHNLGLQHAHSLRCTTPDGRWTAVEERPATCAIDEYGDPFDSMGDAYNQMQFSAHHKAQLGWIPPSRVTTVTASGTYTVSASQIAGGTTQSLRIPVSGTGWYDVDVRRPVTYWDAKVADVPGLLDGVTVRKVDDRGQSLVDTTPDGSMGDAPLRLGRTFTDPNEGISLTVVAVGDTTADVRVTLPDPLPQVYLRGTHNAWGLTRMTPVEGTRGVFSAEVRFGTTSTERFKFDVHGDWRENYGDSDRDGVGDRSGADIPVTTGSGTYLVTFDSTTRRYTLARTAFDSIYPSMHVRGTHNQWGTTTMVLSDSFTWRLTTWLGGQADARLKLDVDGTWGTNFGDSDRDGIAERNGADIAVPNGPGLYDITFDERTRRYSIVRRG